MPALLTRCPRPAYAIIPHDAASAPNDVGKLPPILPRPHRADDVSCPSLRRRVAVFCSLCDEDRPRAVIARIAGGVGR
ncbi:MAG: hypothetical protein H6667_22105 [Ardenticatenaceae bacterium]|nr:hypothetical protein [Ardenticatenaceae bacterium]